MKALLTTLTIGTIAGCTAAPSSGEDQAALVQEVTPVSLLSATFGIADFGGVGPCASSAPVDGLPVVFSTTIAANSVSPSDFEVVRRDGSVATPQCASFFPSVNADEARTILLQGQFGRAGGDDPLSVRIVGDILTSDRTANFRGLTRSVVPYSVGQHLVYARRQSVSSNVGGTDQCPPSASGKTVNQIVQLAFGSNAGTSFPNTTQYFSRFSVKLADGSIATPIAFGDVTVDNYLELCLSAPSPAASVSVATGTVTDASGQLNEVPLSVVLEN